ncbi:hypothetical protein BHE74_00055259 [Ensete ventricosum]|nr:hypothetical protein BHE74_00055259 [Ensete ventricosum]RZS25530.1 hypothetical protein BHM03_00058740 [Ensete ventricosum]
MVGTKIRRISPYRCTEFISVWWYRLVASGPHTDKLDDRYVPPGMGPYRSYGIQNLVYEYRYYGRIGISRIL